MKLKGYKQVQQTLNVPEYQCDNEGCEESGADTTADMEGWIIIREWFFHDDMGAWRQDTVRFCSLTCLYTWSHSLKEDDLYRELSPPF